LPGEKIASCSNWIGGKNPAVGLWVEKIAGDDPPADFKN
jgi:hypothetical protein